MLGHEARTQTIRRWTGLSDDRIRKLYRSYVADGARIKRHRGKSPSRTSFFLSNREHRRHAAGLAGILAALGLLDEPEAELGGGGQKTSLRAAELFCQSFETYTKLYYDQPFSFEHGTHLLRSLRGSSELKAGRCPACHAFMVVDALRTTPAVCTWCESGLCKMRPADVGH
jgi:hypothetical protein